MARFFVNQIMFWCCLGLTAEVALKTGMVGDSCQFLMLTWPQAQVRLEEDGPGLEKWQKQTVKDDPTPRHILSLLEGQGITTPEPIKREFESASGPRKVAASQQPDSCDVSDEFCCYARRLA